MNLLEERNYLLSRLFSDTRIQKLLSTVKQSLDIPCVEIAEDFLEFLRLLNYPARIIHISADNSISMEPNPSRVPVYIPEFGRIVPYQYHVVVETKNFIIDAGTEELVWIKRDYMNILDQHNTMYYVNGLML